MKNVIENYNLKMPKAILLLIALIAAAFIILPLKNILLGLYNWHIRQPETIHGVIELAVLFLVELIFIIKLKKASVIMNIIIIGTLLYMQNHQALIPMIAAVCYFEMIIAIGYSTRSILNISFDDDSFSYLIDFGIGVAVWGTGAIIISLLGFGTFNY